MSESLGDFISLLWFNPEIILKIVHKYVFFGWGTAFPLASLLSPPSSLSAAVPPPAASLI